MECAKVFNICDPSLFCLLIGREQDLHKFEKHHKTLEDYISNKSENENQILKKKTPVIARCSVIGGKWANGVLRNLYSQSEWEVDFKFFSSMEIVESSNIFKCPFKLNNNSKQSGAKFVTCSLKGFVNGTNGRCDWSEESLTYFKKCVEGQTLALISMKSRNNMPLVDLLMRSEDGKSRKLSCIMKDYLHQEMSMKSLSSSPLKVYRTDDDDDDDDDDADDDDADDDDDDDYDDKGDDDFGNIPQEVQDGRHDNGGGCHGSRPWYMDVTEENMEEVCLLMKMSRREIEMLKEYEDIPFDPSKYPSIQQMTSDALSANHSRDRHQKSPRNAVIGRQQTNQKSASIRGRGGHFGLVRDRWEDEVGDAELLSEEVLESRLENILKMKMLMHDRLYEIMSCIGLEGKMISTNQEEANVSSCLRLLLTKYVVDGNHEVPCLEFISQIVGKSNEAHKIWKDAFWTIYTKVIEAKKLSRDHTASFSSFMAGVYNLSLHWIDHMTRELITGDIFLTLEKVIEKIVKDSKERSELLTSFMTNFLSKITEVRKTNSSSDNFKMELKDVMKSSGLQRHLLNLFMTFLDQDHFNDLIYDEGYIKEHESESNLTVYSNNIFPLANKQTSHPLKPRDNWDGDYSSSEEMINAYSDENVCHWNGAMQNHDNPERNLNLSRNNNHTRDNYNKNNNHTRDNYNNNNHTRDNYKNNNHIRDNYNNNNHTRDNYNKNNNHTRDNYNNNKNNCHENKIHCKQNGGFSFNNPSEEFPPLGSTARTGQSSIGKGQSSNRRGRGRQQHQLQPTTH